MISIDCKDCFFRVLAEQKDVEHWHKKFNSTHERAPLMWYEIFKKNPLAPATEYPLYSKQGGSIVYTENARRSFLIAAQTHGLGIWPPECLLAAGEVNGVYAYRTLKGVLDYAYNRNGMRGKLFVVFIGKIVEDKDETVVPEVKEGAVLVQRIKTIGKPMPVEEFIKKWKPLIQ